MYMIMFINWNVIMLTFERNMVEQSSVKEGNQYSNSHKVHVKIYDHTHLCIDHIHWRFSIDELVLFSVEIRVL